MILYVIMYVLYIRRNLQHRIITHHGTYVWTECLYLYKLNVFPCLLIMLGLVPGFLVGASSGMILNHSTYSYIAGFYVPMHATFTRLNTVLSHYRGSNPWLQVFHNDFCHSMLCERLLPPDILVHLYIYINLIGFTKQTLE